MLLDYTAFQERLHMLATIACKLVLHSAVIFKVDTIEALHAAGVTECSPQIVKLNDVQH